MENLFGVIELVLFELLFVTFVVEIAVMTVYGCRYIYGERFILLLDEIKYGVFVDFGNSLIHLEQKTDLNGRYITSNIPSFITPYCVKCGENYETIFRVIRWTKAYYLIKNKYKELYQKNK